MKKKVYVETKEYGIDIGTGYVKYRGGEFLSSIEVGYLRTYKEDVHAVKFGDVNYIVGMSTGNLVIEENRYFSDSYLILLLTAIALSSKNKEGIIEANVVLGVPAVNYDELAEKIQEHYGKSGVKEITVDGKLHIIDIKSVSVFIEGALPILNNDDEKILVIDVGASRIGIILWENQENMYNYMFHESLYSLYMNMSIILNKKYGIKATIQEVEQFIDIKNIEINDKIVIVPEMKIMLENFIMECAGYIQMNKKFEYITCKKIVIIGGGAEKTFKYFKKAFPKAEMVDRYQFINQQVYQAVAEALSDEE